MLEHWIQPISNAGFQQNPHDSDRIRNNLATLSGDRFHSSDSREVALIAGDARWGKLVRRHLYQFAYRMPSIRVYDLGDLRRSDPDFVVGPLMELLEAGVVPVVYGVHIGMTKALRQGFDYVRRKMIPTIACERVPPDSYSGDHPLSVIGVQQHLMPPKDLKQIHTLHLSHARTNPSEADILIRESNAFVFDLSALASNDLPAQRSMSASGFNALEGCMLMRYAGLHDGTRAVMVTGHDPLSLQLDSSANTTAQLIWYFLEAFDQCIAEDPRTSAFCRKYALHLDGYDLNFQFFKSERTARWWMQVSGAENEPIYPCTYEDYLCGVNGQITDRMIACTNHSLQFS